MATPPPFSDSPTISAGDAADLERRVMAAVKASELRGDPPLLRAVEAARCCFSGEFPNADLAAVLVSNLCFEWNTPDMWKLVDQVMANRLVYPPHALALLSSRVIPNRKSQPEAYRLYLELMRSYSLSLPLLTSGPSRNKIIKAMDEALQLSSKYGIENLDFGLVIVLFVLNTITNLIDSTLEDFGLPFISKDRNVNESSQLMDIDVKNGPSEKKNELRRNNSLLALEIMENMSSNKKIQISLRLMHLNMPEQFDGLLNRLRFIESHKSTSKILLSSNQILERIFLNMQNAINGQNESKRRGVLEILTRTGSVHSPLSFSNGAGKSGSWISIDIFLENAMDGKTLCPIASFEILTQLTRTLQVVNQASWQETFQALWISALRLVQRDREPIEGPMPKTDSRLCMLLAIIPLCIAKLLKGEKDEIEPSGRQGLVSSLQSLSQFSTLLIPPNSVINAANNAATKAANFVKNGGNNSSNNNVGTMNRNDKSVGSLLHLVVDGCIARDLIDTSAYFWPGYINTNSNLPNNKDNNSSMLMQDNPWSNFMQGAPLTGSLQSALISTPATSVGELEKLNHLALNGSDEERAASSKILCGASLTRGWNIQEHVVRILVKLLSPPLPMDSPVNGAPNHYLTHMHMLNAILSSLSYGDAIHILSLYGVIPEVAAALMPLCEAFGSSPPPPSYKPSNSTGEDASVHSVFSFAFLFLLRLYKFYAPAQEHCVSGRGGPVRQELTLDYLLLMYNSRLNTRTAGAGGSTGLFADSPRQQIYIDSFPKLRAWYCQNQACVASVLSGLSNPSPVHQTANKILNMICRRMNKGGGTGTSGVTSSGTGTGVTGTTSVSSTSSSVSGSSCSEEGMQRILLPAWEVLEAVPFVLEAVLSACAYGRLSSRDLTTGLRDLVDFFPASLATIVSYFSAEITRGIWKNVSMNGTDWPSPAAALHSVESEVKEVLARVGVHIKNCYPRGMPPMLPLPMAALVSLTITFKMDKSSEYTRGVVGQALENCAVGCGWPSMPIIGALWTQKARKWHDFIILSCTRSPFVRDKGAIAQLTQSCFDSFLGANGHPTNGSAPRGVVGLLGESLSNNKDLRPGFLYLRTCRTFHDTHFLSEVIFKLVIESARKLADEWSLSSSGNNHNVNLKSGRISLATAACSVRQVAILGASLICVAGRGLLVQVLFEETVPTVLLSASEQNSKSGNSNPVRNILEGYSMSYLMFLCSALVWGIGPNSAQYTFGSSERRARLVERYMEFINEVLEGNVVLGCEPATWQAHVSCFVGLVVRFAPGWVKSIKTGVLRKLARGLRGWHECQLALELLELGGPGAIEAVVESLF